MSRCSSALVCNAWLVLSACSDLHAQAAMPALIVNATAASRAELSHAMSDALHGWPVAIAEDAFTRDSVMWIERTSPRGAQGRQMQGRELDRPEKFQLIKEGTRCLLIHERTGQRRVLTVSCKAL